MQHSVLAAVILIAATFVDASTNLEIKSSVYFSPPIFLHKGSVKNGYYYDIPFPRGHIALKSFNAELVNENGVPVPLYETYLHHMGIFRYFGPKGVQVDRNSPQYISARNAGVCRNDLEQLFGLGAETRRTSTWIPGPYGVEVGNAMKEVPSGYEERWMLNVHAIDTRDVKDRLGCVECMCSLYNVTRDESGVPLGKDYTGGLRCCYDQTQCKLREGFSAGEARKLYMKYTVEWTDWDESIVPVDVYIFDATDTGKNELHNCKIEYQVKPCDQEKASNVECVDIKKSTVAIPRGGDVVYAAGHQHIGGIGSAMYGQDGRELCRSIPIYGDGDEAGNEAGHVVGISSCTPEPGSVKISDGEMLTLVSNYSNARLHTGVMGLFHLIVAHPQPVQKNIVLNFFTMIKYWW